VHQPEVARLLVLVLAALLALPVVTAVPPAVSAGAFLLEFGTAGAMPALSSLTDAPARQPFPLPGAAADRYAVTGPITGRPLVLVPGFTPEGKDDARARDAGTLLARAGFDVVVPTLPGLTRGRLRPDDVEPVVAALAARPRPTVVIAVSVGAGPALLAAADPRVRDRVTTVVTLGGYASASELVRFFLTGEYEFGDVRGRVRHDPALVRMFVQVNADLLDPDTARALALGEAAGAHATATPRPRLDPADPAGARRLLERVPPGTAALLEQLSPLRVAADIPARLVLVHGRRDRAVPFTESLRLAAARPDRTELLLVSLFGHIEGAGGVARWNEARDFARLWALVYSLLAAG
jgi:pimeloyl-ACP methyl ester carboxylesterase